MKAKLFPKRFLLLKRFVYTFILLSTIIRLIFLIWSFSDLDISLINLGKSIIYGLFFDIGTVSFFTVPFVIYLLLFPKRLYGSILDKIITYFGYSLGLLIFLFSFFAEFTFWEEFKRRFNFIAVDYLIYTNEVIDNINESYPIPLLVSGMILILLALLYLTKQKQTFTRIFTATTTFKEKLSPTVFFVVVVLIFSLFITNKSAEFSENRYNNEIAKTGIYSFFAAFRNNELSYNEFYPTNDDAFTALKKKYNSKYEELLFPNKNSIFRKIHSKDTLSEIKPNVIFICVESLSAKYLGVFGDSLIDTPNLDRLASESIVFTNLFATGTRTVRGMEAITLSIPPTPGRSIVKRKNNTHLFTIGEVFKKKGYERNFFYGGDGYFDNMNTFFGGNGFNIIDRGRGFLLDESISTKRINIEDDEVTFENAWGVCDDDIYNKVIKEADKAFEKGELFFDFVMTTSNHRPYTYPEGRVSTPSGKDRQGALQYTDFAIGDFLRKIKLKPWYKNTVVVIMADHCAYSAGHQALDVASYHIPAFIINAPNINSQKVDKLASQIDMFPTLFSMLNWKYSSNLFGVDILSMKPNEERAFIGNYRKLGLLKENKLMVLNDKKEGDFYQWNSADNKLTTLPENIEYLEETISYYQAADYLFQNEGLKLKTLGLEN